MKQQPVRPWTEWEHNYQQYLTSFAHGLPAFAYPYLRIGTRDFRERGFCIGDLLYSSSHLPQTGDHQHLLNIFEDKDHLIHEPTFALSHEPLSTHNISQIHEKGFFPPDTWLLSHGVKRMDPSSSDVIHEFGCELPGGAILHLPDGGDRSDLVDPAILIGYIQGNIKRWYTTARDVFPDGFYNGSLFLVTGVDITAQFFGSTIIHPSDASPNDIDSLRVKILTHNDPSEYTSFKDNQIPTFIYKHENYRRHVCLCSNREPSIKKKPAFLRGFSIAVCPEDWDEICGKSKGPILFKNPSLHKSFMYRIKEAILTLGWDKHQIWIPSLDIYKPLIHPKVPRHLSRYVLMRLLPHIPKGGIALVHDSDWTNIVKEMEPTEAHELACGHWNTFANKILQHYKVMSRNGLVSLERSSLSKDVSASYVCYIFCFFIALLSWYIYTSILI